MSRPPRSSSTSALRTASTRPTASISHELLHGAIAQSVELRAQIAPTVDRPIAELSPIEHAVLLIGAYELKNQIEIPYRVVINEAVELTKSFGGIDGHKYVNGVLDRQGWPGAKIAAAGRILRIVLKSAEVYHPRVPDCDDVPTAGGEP
jgi:N utilization substance protein B